MHKESHKKKSRIYLFISFKHGNKQGCENVQMKKRFALKEKRN